MNFYQPYKFHGSSKLIPFNTSITEEQCLQQRKDGSYDYMELKYINFLKRKGQPHFTEPQPEMIIRSPEACTENTTQCHTFTVDKSDPRHPIKQCFHAVGCDQKQYVKIDPVNATTLVNGSATVNATELGICEGFEVCQRRVTSTYTDLSQHAGIQPTCQFVRACESALYKRQPHPFNEILGNFKLGTCIPEEACGSAQYERLASTYLEQSHCVQIQVCNESFYEKTPPSKDRDRDCVEIKECDPETEETVAEATPTSDTVCKVITVECDFNQYLDDGGSCKDAEVCAFRQNIETELNQTSNTPRVCVELEQCEFHQKLNYKTDSIEWVCEDLKYTSEFEDIMVLFISGGVSILALLFRLLSK